MYLQLNGDLSPEQGFHMKNTP